MTIHNAFAVQYGSTAIGGLKNINVNNNPEVRKDISLGSPYPQFAAVLAQKPRIPFQADRVDVALGITGGAGVIIDGTNNFVGYFAQLGGDGQPLGGAVHRSYTLTNGLLLPRRLQCSHRQPAMLDLEALGRSSDGATHPIAISDTATLPTIGAGDVEHTLGKIQLGVAGVAPANFEPGCPTELSIDFGNNAQSRGCSSDPFDPYIEQPGIQPVVNLTALSAAVFGPNGVPDVGKKIEHAGTEIYLRKRDGGIGFVADGTAEHVKLTLDGVAVVTSHTGQGTTAAMVNLQITCKTAGGVVPITINPASAIT